MNGWFDRLRLVTGGGSRALGGQRGTTHSLDRSAAVPENEQAVAKGAEVIPFPQVQPAPIRTQSEDVVPAQSEVMAALTDDLERMLAYARGQLYAARVAVPVGINVEFVELQLRSFLSRRGMFQVDLRVDLYDGDARVVIARFEP